MFILDPALAEYATPRQWELLEELAKHGSQRKAAAAGGQGGEGGEYSRAKTAVLKKAAMHGYAPDYDMIHPTAPGFRIRGTSTLYDMQTGAARIQWVKTRVDDEDIQTALEAAVEATKADITRATPVAAPAHANGDLLAMYPVGDHHIGMLADTQECGDSYNLKIAESLLAGAIDSLLVSSPTCGECIVAFMGDLLHYDSYVPETPKHRNKLDADGRAPAMVAITIKAIRYATAAALAKHATVRVIVEVGNHDPYSSIWVREFLAAHYEDEPRVSVDRSPRHFHYYQFGQCLLATHHGHGAKKDNLPAIMAADQPEMWGETSHRYWFTGHLHHDHKKDYPGVSVEQIRILPPADAYTAENGYRAERDMKAIIFHRQHGEVARYIVNPDMITW
jgi:hypothetical protein